MGFGHSKNPTVVMLCWFELLHFWLFVSMLPLIFDSINLYGLQGVYCVDLIVGLKVILAK
jgi:hypothetical protein